MSHTHITCVISLIYKIWEGLPANVADPYIEITRNMELWRGGCAFPIFASQHTKETLCETCEVYYVISTIMTGKLL